MVPNLRGDQLCDEEASDGHPVPVESTNLVGSFNYYSNYSALGGTIGRFGYYGWYATSRQTVFARQIAISSSNAWGRCLRWMRPDRFVE